MADWIQQLALTAHLGHPMVGLWDWPGMGLLVAIAVGGLLLGTWGVTGATSSADAGPPRASGSTA